MALERIITPIQSLSRDPKGLLALKDLLKGEEKEISKHKHGLPEALRALDPARESLGYLWFLEASGSATEADQGFFAAGLNFVASCDALQIRLSPAKFVSLCRKLTEQAILLQKAKEAIGPLIAALQQLEPSEDYITPIHTFVLQLCLLCKCYSAAASILSVHACEVDPSRTALTPTDFLLYCYYGARVHIGRRQYESALQLLLQALTAPTMVINAITMAAYKKYVLICLIHKGHLPHHLPKFAPSSVVRAVKHGFTAYHDISDAYGLSGDALSKLVDKHRDIFSMDGNAGLVDLAVQTRTKRAIQRLTQTYLTLSLEHIARTAGLLSADDAEQHVLQMIETGDILAQIDDAEGLVRFLEDSQTSDDPELTATLTSQIAQSMKLAEKAQVLNYEVSCDKQLISKVESGMLG